MDDLLATLPSTKSLLDDLPSTKDLDEQTSAAVHLGATANADQTTKFWQTSQELGLPLPLVDQETVEQRHRDWVAEQVGKSGPLQTFVGKDPDNIKLINDDIKPLMKIGEFYAGLAQFVYEGGLFGKNQGLGVGARSAVKGNELGRAGYDLQSRRLLGAETADKEQSVRDLQLEMKNFPEHPGVLNKVGGLIGGIVDSLNQSLPMVLASAGLGAVSGGVPGAAAGATLGVMGGLAADQAKVAAGNAYIALESVRDSAGQPLPESTKQLGSTVVGIGTAILNMIGAQHVGQFAKEAFTKALTDTVVQGAQSETYKQAVLQAGKQMAASGAMGAGLMGGQEVINMIGDTLGRVTGGYLNKADVATVLNDSEQLSQFSIKMLGAMVDGAMLFGAMRMPAAGANMVADMGRIAQARDSAAKFDQAFAEAQTSKTREREPAILKEYLEGINNEKVSIPVDVITKMYMGENGMGGLKFSDPNGPLGFVKDLETQVQNSIMNGGDIKIGMADYFSYMKPETHEVLKDHIRQNSEGLTPAEAVDLESNRPQPKEKPDQNMLQDVQTARDQIIANSESLKLPDLAPEVRARMEQHNLELEAYIAERERAPVPSAMDVPVKDEAGRVIHQELTQAIDIERQYLWLDPIFERGNIKAKIPNAIEMSQEQFRLYSKHLQELQREITDGVYRAVEREVRRRETALWKDAVKTETDLAWSDLRNEPRHFADWAIRAGENAKGEKFAVPMKLDPNAVDVLTGGIERRSEMSDAYFAAKDGFHPDELATMLGFGSGKELIDALHSLDAERKATGKNARQHFDQVVKEEATKRVEERLGKLDERIVKEALEAALDVKQIEVLIDEMKALGADQKVTREAIENLVKETHGKLGLKEARDVKGFENLTGKYGRQAEMALLKGDYAGAFLAKQNQLMNFTLAREAKKFDKAMDQLEAEITRFTENRSLKNVDQDYTDRIQQILKVIDVPGGRSDENLLSAIGRKTLHEFVIDKLGEGREIYVADFLNNTVPTSLDNLTAAQAIDLKATIDSLKFHGMKEKFLEAEGKKQEYEAVRDTIVQHIAEVQRNKEVDYKTHGPKSLKKSSKALTRWADSGMLKMEQLFQWIDKRDPLGAMNSYVFRPLKEAQHWKDDMSAKISKELVALKSKEITKRKNELVPNTTLLTKKGRPEKLTRGNMITIALNIGNEGNFQVLTKGRNWAPDDVVNFLNQNMTKAEWDFVAGIWKVTDKLWPEVEKMTKRVSGVAVEKVRGRQIVTPHGTFDGGYYPLIRDALEAPPPVAERTGDVFDRRFFNPFTSSSATKERTGSTYPVSLSLDELPWKLRELVHDLAFREPVSQAQKLLRDPKVVEAMNEHFGTEYTDKLTPWLQYIANDGPVRDARAAEFWEKVFVEARINAVTMLIGLKLSTAFIHGGAALANSIGEVSIKEFVLSTGRLAGDLATGSRTHWKEALEQSGELRNRKHNFDRDIGMAQDKMMNNPTGRRKFQMFATSMVAFLDQMSAVPTFMAAREQALKEGKSLADAIYIGDQAVRNAHGAQGLLDLPSVAKADKLKAMTMFYGYFNHNFNRLRDTGRLYREGDYAKAIWRTMAYLVWPAAIHEMIRPHTGEDDTWGTIAAKALVSQLAGTVPFVRDISYYAMSGYGGQTLLAGMIEAPVKAGKDIYKALDNDDDTDASTMWVKHMVEAPGWLYGFSTKTLASGAQVLYDLAEGNLDPDELEAWPMIKDLRPKAKDH